MFPEMVVAHVDVLRARTEFRETSELESSRVVLEHLAVDGRLGADDRVAKLPHFSEQLHHRNHISKGLRHGDVFSFGGREGNLCLEF